MAVDNIESYTQPLQQFVDLFKPLTVLEVGIGEFGYSTRVWLASGAKVTTIDKNNVNDIAETIAAEYPDTFTFIHQKSGQAFFDINATFQLIFIDGDHSYDGAYTDIQWAKRLLAPTGVIILDDYGVEFGVTDVDENGNLTEGHYGVKQAADDLFDDRWEIWDTGIDFANGAKVFRRKHVATPPETKKRMGRPPKYA